MSVNQDEVIEVVLCPKGIPPIRGRFTLAALERYDRACMESIVKENTKKEIRKISKSDKIFSQIQT